MALLGIMRYSPAFPLGEQRAALLAAGVPEAKIYTIKEDATAEEIISQHIKRRDTVALDGLHRLAPRWAEMVRLLELLAGRGITVIDARTGYSTDEKALLLAAEAQRVYNMESRLTSPKEAARRGALGAAKTNKKREVKLGKEHQRIWRDVVNYPTNQLAADKVSEMLGRKVSVPTLRRRFKKSGRMPGWPGSHDDD